jgi:predicted DNA-binding protein
MGRHGSVKRGRRKRMAYKPDKFTRISVDLTHEEYGRLHHMTTMTGATKMGFVRLAIEEKIDEEERIRQASARNPRK